MHSESGLRRDCVADLERTDKKSNVNQSPVSISAHFDSYTTESNMGVYNFLGIQARRHTVSKITFP